MRTGGTAAMARGRARAAAGAVLGAVVALLLSACGGGPAAGAPQGAERAAFDAAGYRLGSGDEVRLTVFGEADLSGTYAVDGRGDVTMPLVGAVPARGATAPELAARVAEALRAGYLRDPRVTAEVAAYRPYYILGEVERPGEYPYQNGLTVLNAVATAEGFTYRANERVVFIRRDGEAEEVRYGLGTDTPVRPGDTIRIGERLF